VLNIVILAAGKGSRMNSSLPKVLHHLAGEPLLGYVVRIAQQLVDQYGGTIRVVTGFAADRVDPYVESLGLDAVHQAEQLGTGHALQTALDGQLTGDQTLVLYGDVPLVSLADLGFLLEAGSKSLAILTATVSDPSGYGRIIRDEDNSIIDIVEHQDATEQQRSILEINSGIYAAPTALFNELLPHLADKNSQGEYYLTDCVQLSVRAGHQVTGVTGSETSVMGVNDLVQLAELNQMVQVDRREALMRAGVSLIDPSTVFINGPAVNIAPDTVIEPQVTLNSPVVVGHNVTIGFGSHLTDAKIGDNTVIKPYTVVESASIGSQAQVGPFARLRPGTTLSDATHVGNFCETKNAWVGEGSKINHLSYIGDATIGRDVNIGAGTITCNYDGASKNKTIIGNDVFIGSNTSLIAPVTLADGVTTGAGSVITTDVEAGKLALSRSKQISVEGYKRPNKSKD
jgi:bifunctional UDP-N-acetylglucosamine pyrophosphorylase/glucosamine-1-phosphate N-acetyltransferase